MNTMIDPASSFVRTQPAIAAQNNGPRQAATPALPARPVDQELALPAMPALPAQPNPAPSRQTDIFEEVERRLNESTDYQLIRKILGPKIQDDTKNIPAPAPSTEPVGQSSSSVVTAHSESFSTQWSMDIESVTPNTLETGISASGTTRIRIASQIQQDTLHINFQMNNAQSAQLSAQQAVQQADPLVLDLGGNGVQTTGIERGVTFDITGDGRQEQVSFVTGDSWFLALDRNDNGRIDDGRELFGDQNGAANGFEELRRYDENGDGVINDQDSVFTQLRLFQMDRDGNQTMKDLASAGVNEIHLDYQDTAKKLNDYDVIAQMGQFARNDGSRGQAVDVLLGYRAL